MSSRVEDSRASVGVVSPIVEIVRALVGERGGSAAGQAWRVVADFDEKAIASFFHDKKDGSDVRHLFIKTGLARGVLNPWLALIESVVGGGGGGGFSQGAVLDVTDPRGPELLKSVVRRVERFFGAPQGERVDFRFQEDIAEREGLIEARQSLVRTARCESEAGPEYDRRFGRLAGGCRPVVVVLDDYNNLIVKNEAGVFGVAAHIKATRAAQYATCHCATLNNLGIAFAVEAPSVQVGEDRRDVYAAVREVLPVELLDQWRSRICAFVVDLGWSVLEVFGEEVSGGGEGLGAEGWTGRGGAGGARVEPGPALGAGLAALKLLTERYPEVPSFVYTGQWSDRRLLDGLVHGACWCFQKRKSHHGPGVGMEGKALSVVSLEEQLTAAVTMRCGAYPDPPDRRQLQLEGSDAGARLKKALKITAPIHGSARGGELQRLVASLFPSAKWVTPRRVVVSGRSRSLRGTFVVDVEGAEGQTAKRFVKLASWPAIVGEWLAYRRVIEPRLSSHVAQIASGPVMVGGAGRGGGGRLERSGAIAYSLVGFPESGELRSLGERLRAGAESGVARQVEETFSRVLRGLYRSRRRVVRSLWSWLGDVLPPLFTGVLVPLDGPEGDLAKERQWTVNASWIGVADRQDEAKSAAEAVRVVEESKIDDESEATPWEYPKGRMVWLNGFEFSEMAAGGESAQLGYLTLRHPILGFRIRLRGVPDDVRDRFGAAWLRPGMPVHVGAVLDGRSRDLSTLAAMVDGAAGRGGFASREALLRKCRENWGWSTVAVDPLTVFAYCADERRLQFGVEAWEGPIHGDLNLENLMFSGRDGPAWLIDFDNAVERGMIAFDLAKLEVEIWNHEILRLFTEDFTPQKGLRVLGDVLERLDRGTWEGEEKNLLGAEYASPHRDRLNELLGIVCCLRRFCKQLRLTREESGWARSVYALASLKFLEDEGRRLLAYAASIWHVSTVARGTKGLGGVSGRILGLADSWSKGREDALVGEVDAQGCNEAVADAVGGARIEWSAEESVERWDVISTGGVGDAMELIGHLWLLVRAERGRGRVIVPKIANRGSGVNFVDVLECGGYGFANHLHAIRRECAAWGSSVGRGEVVVPALDALLERGRVVGAMRNDLLTYLSVMSRLVASGCTHGVVGVKGTGCGNGLLTGDIVERLESFLEDIGVKVTRHEQGGRRWLVQEVDGLGAVREVRWCSTNGNFPQGRAIGGVLALLHLDGLVRGSYGAGEGWDVQEPLLWVDGGGEARNQHSEFFCSTLPDLCDVPAAQRNREALEEAWNTLRRRMQSENLAEASPWSRAVIESAQRWMVGFDRSGHTERRLDLDRWDSELSVYSVGAYPYCPGSSSDEEQVVAGYRMGPFDRFFRWLCGRERNAVAGPLGDAAAVGLWLHALPGELWRPGSPLVSVFYRPGRTSERAVVERLKYVLREGAVSVKSLGR